MGKTGKKRKIKPHEKQKAKRFPTHFIKGQEIHISSFSLSLASSHYLIHSFRGEERKKKKYNEKRGFHVESEKRYVGRI